MPSPIGKIVFSILGSFFIWTLNSLIILVNLSFLFKSATSPFHKTLSIIINPLLEIKFNANS